MQHRREAFDDFDSPLVTDLRARPCALGIVGVSIWVLPLVAQSVDVVLLENGDAITGEIKKLERARLRLNTDAAGDIFIEWPQVRSVTAPGLFEIELKSGQRFFGGLQPASSDGRILIIGPEPAERVEVGLFELVRITPIQSTFWTRLEGLIEFGFTFAKANQALNLNSRVNVDYRGRSVEHRLSGSVFVQSQEDAEKTSRVTGSWQTTRLLGGRWAVGGQLTGERNDELALDVRAGISVFGGRALAQTNNVDWYMFGGVRLNRERFASEESTATTYETPVGTRLNVFLFGDHETILDISYVVYPNLSDFGRVRMDFDASFRRDLFLDFFVALSGYDSFDSRPGTATSGNDLGFSFSVGYDF